MCELSPPASTDADADADAIAFLLWLCTSLTTPLILTQSLICAASGSIGAIHLRGPQMRRRKRLLWPDMLTGWGSDARSSGVPLP